MYCKNCGNKLNEGSKFCGNCGESVNVVEEKKAPTEEIVDAVEEKNVTTEKVETLNVTNEPKNQNVTNESINSNVQNVNPAPKKSNAVFIVLIVIFAIIILGLITFICVYSIRSNNKTIESEITEEEPKVEETKKTTQIDTSNTVSLKGYDFTIPYGWKYDSETMDNFLGVKNDENTIIAYFSPLNFSADTSDSSINSYKETLISKGYSVNDYTLVNADDVTFVLIDATYDGKQVYFAYASYGDYTIDSVFKVNDITATEALKKLSVIYSSAKLKSSNFSSTDDKSIPVPDSIKDSFK